MYRFNPIVIVMLIMFLSFTATVTAQDQPTATPAPSKTPTAIPQASEATSEAKPPVMEPWTQADLSILTGNVQRPNGVVWFNSRLYAVCTGDSTVYELDDTSGATRTYIFGVRNAHTLHAEQNAAGELSLWVPDFQTNRLLRVDRNGVATISTELAGPWGIAELTEDEFLVTNLQANNVVIINRSGEIRELVNGLRSPTGIVNDEEYLYVANTGSARRAIEWVNKGEALDSGTATAATQPLVTGLQNATGMALGEDGYLYFTYALGTRGVVGRVDPDVCREKGGCTNSEVEIVIYTELAAPLAGLTISPDMRLFVHTIFSPDIYWVNLNDASGQVTALSS